VNVDIVFVQTTPPSQFHLDLLAVPTSLSARDGSKRVCLLCGEH
jgi:hypothetical protein